MTESQTGGVRPMAIAGRMISERERLLGMSAEERAWRAQWVKDQRLAPHEPVYVPELIKATINPIRRFYRAPLEAVYTTLTPVLVCRIIFYVVHSEEGMLHNNKQNVLYYHVLVDNCVNMLK